MSHIERIGDAAYAVFTDAPQALVAAVRDAHDAKQQKEKECERDRHLGASLSNSIDPRREAQPPPR